MTETRRSLDERPVRRVARHPECTDADWASLEAECNAAGVRLEEVPPLEFMAHLRRLYEACKLVREQRRLIADRAEQDRQLAALGVDLREQFLTCNFWRDKRGNLLSAEHEFVSEASAFHGATDAQIAEVLRPDAMTGNRAELRDAAINAVHRMKSDLRARHIIVG